MSKFRLPRKTKKYLKKGLYGYMTEDCDICMLAEPHSNHHHYRDYKRKLVLKIV